jgi:hypothetical protein
MTGPGHIVPATVPTVSKLPDMEKLLSGMFSDEMKAALQEKGEEFESDVKAGMKALYNRLLILSSKADLILGEDLVDFVAGPSKDLPTPSPMPESDNEIAALLSMSPKLKPLKELLEQGERVEHETRFYLKTLWDELSRIDQKLNMISGRNLPK